MERQVIFRDYQEQQAADHNDLQDAVRVSVDHIVRDAVTSLRRFAGFTVTKTAQTEVQISPGRFYDVEGVIFNLGSTTTQSMLPYLAAVAQRWVLLSVVGNEVETDIEERDYLVDVSTGATEPRAVATIRSRAAILNMTSGVESAQPVRPAVPIGHVAVAFILLDPLQVVEIEMQVQNQVVSTQELDTRAEVLEEFRRAMEPRITSIASDLADLANRVAQLAQGTSMTRIFEDLARLKESLRYPPSASGYGADFFLDPGESDYENTALLGYDAKVEMGCRFGDANMDEFEISLFSANDPNAANYSGLLLPKFTEELKVQTSGYNSDIGIAQYGYQTHEMRVGYMSRSRIRYGGSYTQCSNGVMFNTPGEPVDATGLYDFNTVGFDGANNVLDPNPRHYVFQRNSYWLDTWKEPFMYQVTVDHTINGALVAQTFLASNDFIATKFGFYCTSKAADEAVHLALCEVTTGLPDITKTMIKTVLPGNQLAVGWNYIAVRPTFLQKGKRYAVVLISNANHRLGMGTGGASYLDGTFFYSTDGIYYQGDLTKDLLLLVYGAKFNSPQVTIEFEPINLDGGFRNIDILSEMWVPDSCQLVFEMRPGGSGEWMPIVFDNGAILATAPPLAQFRARFIGTRDMQPMLHMNGSRVRVWRPKVTFKHVSTLITVPALPGTANNVTCKCTLENYDETPHDHTLQVRVGATDYNAVTTVTKLTDAEAKRYERTYTFSLPAGTTQFRFVQIGATNSASMTYHVAERIYYTS